MALVFGQYVGKERRVLDYYENNGEEISHYIDHMKKSRFRIDRIALPHDGKSHSCLSKYSADEKMRQAFPNAEILIVGRDSEGKKIGLEDQIDAVRSSFAYAYIDPDGAALLLHRLKRYKRRHDKASNTFREPLHDENSNGADAFRSFMLAEPPRKKSSGRTLQMHVPSIM
jgi:hypothetical protein